MYRPGTPRPRRAPDVIDGLRCSIPPEGPDRCVYQAGGNRGNVSQSLPPALVAEREMLGSKTLGGLGVARRPLGQQPYLGSGTDAQEPRPESRLPGAEDSRDRQRTWQPVRTGPANQRQHIGGPAGGDEPDTRRRQRPEDLAEPGHAQLAVLARRQPGKPAAEGRMLTDRGRTGVVLLFLLRGQRTVPPARQHLGGIQVIKLGDIGRAVEEGVKEQASRILAWRIAQQDRHQPGLLAQVRKHRPDPSSFGYHLSGDPRHRHPGTLLGKDSPASREHHRPEPRLSLLRQPACGHRLIPSCPPNLAPGDAGQVTADVLAVAPSDHGNGLTADDQPATAHPWRPGKASIRTAQCPLQLSGTVSKQALSLSFNLFPGQHRLGCAWHVCFAGEKVAGCWAFAAAFGPAGPGAGGFRDTGGRPQAGADVAKPPADPSRG